MHSLKTSDPPYILPPLPPPLKFMNSPCILWNGLLFSEGNHLFQQLAATNYFFYHVLALHYLFHKYRCLSLRLSGGRPIVMATPESFLAGPSVQQVSEQDLDEVKRDVRVRMQRGGWVGGGGGGGSCLLFRRRPCCFLQRRCLLNEADTRRR